jgi:hypothetical protein
VVGWLAAYVVTVPPSLMLLLPLPVATKLELESCSHIVRELQPLSLLLLLLIGPIVRGLLIELNCNNNDYELFLYYACLVSYHLSDWT